jgi:hypothetical protein
MRNVQADLDELRQMRQISEGNPKELERFVDILERTVDTLVRGPFYQYGRQFVQGDWIRNCVFVSLW